MYYIIVHTKVSYFVLIFYTRKKDIKYSKLLLTHLIVVNSSNQLTTILNRTSGLCMTNNRALGKCWCKLAKNSDSGDYTSNGE